jgi:stalled ribosome rescue protein Dom34
MAKSVGLWIDRQKAVIVSLAGRLQAVTRVESGVKRARYRGAQRSSRPYSAQYSQGDDQLDKQYMHHLDKYYKRVMLQLRSADQVLIFGPGEAKSDLKKHLARDKSRDRNVTVETADLMTDRQIVARVRRQFEGAPARAVRRGR